ncbi:HAAS signaling domain-containing protein [Fictibacillus sp. BK138]|uniref:HAAS signaling domain-containing protein n=1 Tax=Fictibacillus sp. BK138 TaxID=2512121 RepID=UPI001029AE9E|nr:DUF1700 domain-containing protein [Fictibacillus sp. BK138]RZT23392.1 putative membrane protein [Fictibacillus sp. BK138]
MDKKTYLNELAKEIKSLPLHEQKEVLEDYEEHFNMAQESGRSDEDIISGLGSPRKIAKELLAHSEITRAEEDPSLSSVTRAVFATLGLGLFNLIFVLAPFIVLILIPVVLVIVSGALLVSPFLLLFQDGLTATFLKEVFLILGLIGLGLLFFAGALKASRVVYKMTLSYLSFNLRIIRRKYT